MADYFDEAFYLQGKVDQLNSLGEMDAGGRPYTTQSLQSLLRSLGMTPEDHYETYGAYETFADGSHISPSGIFNADAYFQNKLVQVITKEPEHGWTMPELLATMQASGMSPLTHYQRYGMAEEQASGLSLYSSWESKYQFPSKWEFMKAVYFDENAYVRNKTEALNAAGAEGHAWTVDETLLAIRDAGLTPWEHFSRYGAFERAANGGYGINPSQYFDLDTYYADLRAHYAEETGAVYSKQAIIEQLQGANLDPITHYSLLGFRCLVTPRLENLETRTYSDKTYGRDVPLSGDDKIDSLLLWMAGVNGAAVKQENTLYYAFPERPVNGNAMPLYITNNFKELGADAKQNVRDSAEYLSKITGIHLEYTDVLSEASFLFYEGGLVNAGALTVCGNLTDAAPKPYEIIFHTGMSTKYQNLLHEWGHALGLKHPFDVDANFSAVLPRGEDNRYYTVMSYSLAYVYPEFATGDSKDLYDRYFSPFDIMALNYIYGTDGLNGQEGLVYEPRIAATGVTTATEFGDAQGV
jgi:hypothetical protein